MDNRAILRVAIGFYIRSMLWALLQSLSQSFTWICVLLQSSCPIPAAEAMTYVWRELMKAQKARACATLGLSQVYSVVSGWSSKEDPC